MPQAQVPTIFCSECGPAASMREGGTSGPKTGSRPLWENGSRKLDPVDLQLACEEAISHLSELHAVLLEIVDRDRSSTQSRVNARVNAVFSELREEFGREVTDAIEKKMDEKRWIPAENDTVRGPSKARMSQPLPGADGDKVALQEEVKQEAAEKHKERSNKTTKLAAEVGKTAAPTAATITTAEGSVVKNNVFGRALAAKSFDIFSGCMIVLNSILIGIETQWLTSNLLVPSVLEVLNYLCVTYFLIEVLFRIGAYGKTFLSDPHNRGWNLFDSSIVLVSLLDIAVVLGLNSDEAAEFASYLKAMKMLRILRLLRLARFLRELTMLALMIIDSMRSLFWAMVLLELVMFGTSVCLTTSASAYLKGFIEEQHGDDWFDSMVSHDQQNVRDVWKYFGGLGSTHQSLLMTMLGGISWGELLDILTKTDALAAILFLCYTLFSILAVMNIVTGVFVENAVALAKSQTDYRLEQEEASKAAHMKELGKAFIHLDDDGSASLTQTELQDLFHDPTAQPALLELGFQPHECSKLFTMIDVDNSGMVDLDEFLEGCMRLKGSARALEVEYCTMQLTQMRQLLEDFKNDFVETGLLKNAQKTEPL